MDALTFIKNDNFEESAIETVDVAFEASTVALNTSFKSVENLTIVVFADLNNNGKYDMGENADVDFNTYDAGENKSIDMTISY